MRFATVRIIPMTDQKATATPRMIDTGTGFANSKHCDNCERRITRAFGGDERAARGAWYHTASGSIYCHPDGD